MRISCTHQHAAGLSVQSSRTHPLPDHGNIQRSKEEFAESCSGGGVSSVEETECKIPIIPGSEDDVKLPRWLDIHHLGISVL